MAELDVVRKKKPIFPWILLALLIIGIIAFLLLNNNDAGDATAAPTATDTSVQQQPGGTGQ